MKYVYLLRSGENHYKIGVATNVTRRIKELQTSNPRKIDLVLNRLVEDAYIIENKLHTQLHEMKADGGREWFMLSPEQAIELAIELNKVTEIDMTQQITVRSILKQQTDRQMLIEDKLNFVIDEYQKTLPPPYVPEPPKPKPEKPSHDELINIDLERAMVVFRLEGKASTSLLQRKLSIGYGRAARIVEQLETLGFISPQDGSRPRQVLFMSGDVDIAKRKHLELQRASAPRRVVLY